MKFVAAVWKLLVGVKDALVLVLLLLFFGAIYMGLSVRPAPVSAGVLTLDLFGSVVEQPSRAQLLDALGGTAPSEYRLRDLVEALESARTDDRVKAVALDLERFVGGGQAAMAELAQAVRRVRESGKPVIAYATAYGDDGYLVASAASEVWLNPLGGVAIAGPGGSNLYFSGLLEKLGITANVYRVGTYKAAVEPFTRSDMSDEAKENAQALGDSLLESWRDEVLKNRPKAKLDPYMLNPVGAVAAADGDLAKAAIGFGLVDKIGPHDAFQDRLAELGGEDSGSKGGYKRIALSDYVDDTVTDNDSGSIGVVTVAGMIVDGEASAGTAGGDSIAAIIDEAVREGGLEALVVRVDSPGGSVIASERIRQSILNAKREDIPVVVSMGNVAASGGYWISTPADFIFAEPSTITGSIGVFGILPSFEGTLDKLGIGADGIKTTPLSGEPDLLTGPSPAADALIQSSVNSIYRRFLAIVAESRNKPPEAIDRIAQGRVWDGGTARQLGLVDGFGGMDEAVRKAGTLAKIDDPEAQLRYLERPRSFEEQLVEFFVSDSAPPEQAPDSFAALASQASIVDALVQLRGVLAGPRIQVRCLECPVVTPARLKAEDVSFLSALRAWLL
ncbi:MAG TPA: signal peptide peptidase SppA [Sphingomicrobium sp.]|nr:signal peptide peptidase SppA [Sphingomicrobium sp.]